MKNAAGVQKIHMIGHNMATVRLYVKWKRKFARKNIA
jgi:hypothetical protein